MDDLEEFPRGGQQALTALEYRAIKSKAEKDALFENEANDEEMADLKEAKAKKRKPQERDVKDTKDATDGKPDKKKKKKDTKGAAAAAPDAAAAPKRHVESLSLKRIEAGMNVLGVVREVQNFQLNVSLPHGLQGIVKITEVSPRFSQYIVGLAAEMEKEEERKQMDTEEEEEEEEDDDSKPIKVPTLHDYFTVNQFVVCNIKAVEEQEHHKDEIVLTLAPAAINAHLHAKSLLQGLALVGAVESVEDHGYVLDLGVEGEKGFLSRKNAKAVERDGKRLVPGQPLSLCVLADRVQGRPVQVTADPEAIKTAEAAEKHALTIDAIAPGLRVPAIVSEIAKNGLFVSFLGFEGHVDAFHMPAPVPDASKIGEQYKVKQPVAARVLYVNHATKTIGVSLREQIVNLACGHDEHVQIGQTFPDAEVARLDYSVGMLMKLAEADGKPVYGYCLMSRISDAHLDKFTLQHKVGSHHKARVIGFDLVDGTIHVSTQPSVLDAAFVRAEDVRVGQVVSGTVLSVEPYGVMVSLTHTIKALVPLDQLADVAIKNPEKRFKVGEKVKCRVLRNSVKKGLRRILLTMKKTLVKTDLPLVLTYEDAKQDVVTHGYISEIRPFGCMINLYGRVRALCPNRFLSATERIEDPSSYFKVGQVVKCKILTPDAKPGNLIVSLNLQYDPAAKENAGEVKKAVDAIASGSLLKVRVTAKTENAVSVELLDQPLVKGRIDAAHISDHAALCAPKLAALQVGQIIDGVLVVSKEGEKHNHLVLSLKQSLKDAAADAAAPKSIEALKAGDIYRGFVRSIQAYGCFVGLVHGVVGLVNIRELAHRFIDVPASHFTVGQSVTVVMKDLDKDASKANFSMKLGDVDVPAAIPQGLLATYFSDLDAAAKGNAKADSVSKVVLGSVVTVTVESVKPYGVAVKLDGGAAGFVTKDHLGEDKYEAGQTHEARVLDVDKLKGVVDLTLRKALVDAGKKASKAKLKAGETGEAEILLVKEDYLVLALPKQRLGFALAKALNDNRPPFTKYKSGAKGAVTVVDVGAERVLATFELPEAEEGAKGEGAKGEGKAKAEAVPALEIGDVVTAKVLSVQDMQVNVELPGKRRGRVHITEAQDETDKADDAPFAKLAKDQEIKVRVIGFNEAKAKKQQEQQQQQDGDKKPKKVHPFVECTMKKSQMTAKKLKSPLASFAGIKTGETVYGYVQEVQDDCIWVSISITLRGLIHQLQISKDMAVLKDLFDHFPLGKRLRCTVAAVDAEKNTIDLSLVGKATALKVGSVVNGQIVKIYPNALKLRLPNGSFGKVHVTDIADKYKKDPTKGYAEGTMVNCFVKKVDGDKVFLSTRPSRVLGVGEVTDPEISSFDDVKADQVVRGYIKHVTDSGVFVTIGADVTARVLITNLSDLFIKDFKSAFQEHMLVRGRVIHLDAKQKRIEMTLKQSVVDPANFSRPLQFGDLTMGQAVSGIVKRVETYGLFIQLEGSQLTAMSHISEISDKFIKDLSAKFKQGDVVKGKVIKTDPEKKKVWLGLKRSYFPDEEFDSESEDEDEGAEEGAEEGKKGKAATKKKKSKNEDESQSESESEDDDTVDTTALVEKIKSKSKGKSGAAAAAAMDESEDEEDGSESEEEEEDGSEPESDSESEDEVEEDTSAARKRKRGNTEGTLKIDAPMSLLWNTDAQSGLPDLSGSDSEGSEDEEDEDESGKKKLSKRAKRAAKKEQEERIQAAEQLHAAGGGEPKSAEDFDRLVLGSPNSSYTWVKYIAFHLQMTELDKARAVAERALKTITYKDEGERMNVWIARLNLENTYGTPETLKTVFDEAVKTNDAEKMYFHLASIYERSNKLREADETYQAMLKRFKSNKDIWISYGNFKMTHGKSIEARNILQRSLQSLPKADHISVIVKFGIMEFRNGDVDRGRTIFESVLSNYPKRVDLWSVYLDQEIRQGDVSVIRALFERVVTLNLSSKKMKFFFKRYLEFEKEHGTAQTVEHVKDKAREYVQSRTD